MRQGRGDYFFFFNDTATTEIYTLSLHDALPISGHQPAGGGHDPVGGDLASRARQHAADRTGRTRAPGGGRDRPVDRKSTRLNSSHANISYAVFCLKKKNKPINSTSAHLLYDIFF